MKKWKLRQEKKRKESEERLKILEKKQENKGKGLNKDWRIIEWILKIYWRIIEIKLNKI